MIAIIFFANAANANIQIDQSNLPTWDGGWTDMSRDQSQTFQPGLPILTGIDIAILTVNPHLVDDIITVKILKSDVVLATASQLVTAGFSELLHFDFPTEVVVNVGETYVLSVTGTKDTFGWKFGGDTYSNGISFLGEEEKPHTDWLFQTYGILAIGAPPIADVGSYIIVNVIDSSTLEQVDVSEFDVEMRVEPPHDYLNVNFTIQNRNQSLYFAMPPSNYSAKAYIYAKKNGYLDSTPLVIDSSFYWERMREPDLEYLTEHTFYLKPSGLDASSFNTNTGLIGTEGGTITTASGAAIVIPPGALDSNTTITITSYDTQSNLPEYNGIMGNFISGLTLSPDGLNFQIPVTITIPLNETITSGNEVKLFNYDDGDPDNSNYPANYSGWQQTNFAGTVSSNEQSVVAQIDHFSTYVIQMNFGENTLDILGDMVETFGDNGLGVDFERYQTYFESAVAKLGDLHTYDLPGGFGYDCYKVVGIEYILYHDMGLLFENPLRNFKGTEGEIAFYYNYEGNMEVLEGGQLNQYIYHLFINVYIDRTPPAINLTAARTTVRIGEQTNVSSCLSCGADKMKNQDVYFSVNSLGSIYPTQQITNNYGYATIRFIAGNVEGIASVTGEYSAHNKDQIEIISDDVNITIEESDERYESWSGTITVDIHQLEGIFSNQAHVNLKIDYQFSVEFPTEGHGHVVGIATATQNVTITFELPDFTVQNLNAPTTLSFIIDGTVYADDNSLYLHIIRDENETPFYTYDVYDTVVQHSWPTSGPRQLLIGHYNTIPLNEGTYSGTNTEAIVYPASTVTYTITLKRNE